MENGDGEIRDILLKIYDLQQKQYEEHKANSGLYRQAIARQRTITLAAGCLFAILLGLVGLTTAAIIAAR